MRITTHYKSNLELSVCLSLITAQPLEMNDIAVNEGGLTFTQISFLELLEKITNGASFIINETGCRLRVIPGTLIGGEIEHDCDKESAIGHYAMYLIMLAPFCQKPLDVKLTGVTNRPNSMSIECLNYSVGDILKDVIGIASMFEMVVKQRGAYPNGGGLVNFKARPVQSLKPLDRVKVGKLQK